MSSYRQRRRLAPAMWTFIVLLVLPPGWLQRVHASTPELWHSALTHDALMESFRNPMITSGQYNRFLMTQNPWQLLGGGGDDFLDPNERGDRWTAEPNAQWLNRVEWAEQDLSLPGIAFDLVFSRIYRGSVQSYDGPLGQQWDFSWNKRMKRVGSYPSNIEFYEMGRIDAYTYNSGSGTWTSPAGRYDTLVDNGSYIERTDRFGVVETYDNLDSTWLSLTEIVDSLDVDGNNKLTFVYAADWQGSVKLEQVFNDAGFLVTFDYDSAGHIILVEDYGNREWHYTYSTAFADGKSRLVEVSGPPTILGGSLSGHSFVESVGGTNVGRRTKYQYDYSTGALLNISQPNDSTSTNFTASWAWIYDGSGNVVTQTVNSGHFRISYDFTGGKITVLDRQDNKTVYEYDASARVTKRKTYYDATNSWDTTWAYNSNHEVTEVVFPKGNRVAYSYDGSGNILDVKFKKDASDGTPIQWTYTYAAYSRLSTLTDPNGRTWDYDYDNEGNLTKRTAPTVTVPVLSGGADPSDTNKNATNNLTNDGIIVETWAYDEWGNVTTATDAMGTVRSAEYAVAVTGETQKANLTKLTVDPGSSPHLQAVYQWVYDGLGHAITFIDPTDSGGNKTTEYYWNSEDELIRVDEPGGVISDYFHDLNGNIVQETVTDDNVAGNGVFTSDMAFDRLNNITRLVVDQDASTTVRLTTTYAYDKNDRLTGLTEPGNQITQWTYDVRDLRTAITRKAATSADDAITTVGYDANGNRISFTSPRDVTYVTDMAYDGYDRVTKVTRPEGDYRTFAHDATGNVTSVSFYNVGNTKLAETKYAFDEANRHYQTERLAKKADLTTSIDDGWQTRTLWRDENGNVLEVLGDGCGCSRNTYVFDALERLITITDAMPTSPNNHQNREIRDYDLFGNLLRVTSKQKSQASTVEPDKDVVVEFEYDVRHRMTLRADKISTGVYAETTYDYNKRDQVTLVTDGALRATKYEYNEHLWPTKEWVAFPGGSTNDVVTEHLYDMGARKVTYKATNGTTGNQLTVYEYDPLWRLIHTTWPDGGISDYTYDEASNRIGYTDLNETTRVIEYDKNDRLTLQDNDLDTNVVGATQLTFDYDALDRLTATHAFEGTAFDVLDVWTYNTLGKPETEQQVIDGYNSGNGRTFTYVWDTDGDVVSATYPTSGSVVTYERDNLDRVDKISIGSSQLVDYTFNGPRVIRKALPGSRATYTYDGLGRLTDILHEETTAGPDLDLAEFVYRYDMGHQVTSLDKHYWNDSTGTHVTITADGSDNGEQYGYDAAGRLVTCLRGVPTAYVSSDIATNTHYEAKAEYLYDQTGNRTSRIVTPSGGGPTGTSYAYDVANQMTTEAGTTQVYSANGSFTGPSGSGNRYKYDFTDRLGEATPASTTYTYHYDALGRMVQRDHSSSLSIRFYYDGLHIVEQNRWQLNLGSWSEVSRKVFFFGPVIDELLLYVDTAANPDEYHYAHSDRLGSVQLFVDANGDIEESYRYKEFGETTIVNGSFTKLTTTVDSPIGNPHRYTGRRQDIQVGNYGDDWYDYRARIMRPAVGRFTQDDPIGYADGPNRYVYVGNRPADMTDAFGLFGGTDDAHILAMQWAPNGPGWWFENAIDDAIKGAVPDGLTNLTPKELQLWADESGTGAFNIDAINTFARNSHPGMPGGYRGKGDAVQHCVRACALSVEEAAGGIKKGTARKWTRWHEEDFLPEPIDPDTLMCGPPPDLLKDLREAFDNYRDWEQDLHNNEEGHKIGEGGAKNGDDCKSGCKDALGAGKLDIGINGGNGTDGND